MIETAAYTFIIIGVLFDLLGALGLVRFPDVYNRLQAATKCVTLGNCCILFGVFLHFGFQSAGIKALLCILFIVITAPVSAHALARGSHRGNIPLWHKSVIDVYEEDRDNE